MDEVIVALKKKGAAEHGRQRWCGKGKGMHGWGCGHVCACTVMDEAQASIDKGMHMHRHSVRVHSP